MFLQWFLGPFRYSFSVAKNNELCVCQGYKNIYCEVYSLDIKNHATYIIYFI